VRSLPYPNATCFPFLNITSSTLYHRPCLLENPTRAEYLRPSRCTCCKLHLLTFSTRAFKAPGCAIVSEVKVPKGFEVGAGCSSKWYRRTVEHCPGVLVHDQATTPRLLKAHRGTYFRVAYEVDLTYDILTPWKCSVIVKLPSYSIVYYSVARTSKCFMPFPLD